MQYTSEPLLTQKAIRQGIFSAIKSKTNYNMIDNVNKTGGIFVDSIWLDTNYNQTDNTQFVIGKIIHDVMNSNEYVKADQYNTIMSSNVQINVNPDRRLGLYSQTELNKIPVVDARYIFTKMIHDDAEKYNLHLKMIDDKYRMNDQQLFLSARDIVYSNGNTYVSSIYDSENNEKLIYNINGSQFNITNKTDETIYYPETLIIAKNKPNPRYSYYSENNANYIKSIDNVMLNNKIYCDFDIIPEYEYNEYVLQ
jgi:hypothetical protein